jgi:hypothetical protein
MNESELIATLRENRFMRSEDEITAFDQALSSLPYELDQRYLAELYTIFDDRCQYPPAMYGLIQYIEEFEPELTTNLAIDMIPTLLEQAQEWCVLLHSRIFLCEPCGVHYKHKVEQLSMPERERLKGVLQKIVREFASVPDGNPKRMKDSAIQMIHYIDGLPARDDAL